MCHVAACLSKSRAQYNLCFENRASVMPVAGLMLQTEISDLVLEGAYESLSWQVPGFIPLLTR